MSELKLVKNDVDLKPEDLPQIQNIMALQEEMMSWPEEMKYIPPVNHHFAPGLYAREMMIPKGTLIVGKIHKHAHLNHISYGKICVSTFEGVVCLEGPLTMVSPVGVKRVVYALEDTLWTTFHVTEETDLEKIEHYVIAKEYSEIESLAEIKEQLEKLL